MKILTNDGLSSKGIKVLRDAGFEVIETRVAQQQLINFINTHEIEILLVRSATLVKKELIDSCPSLRIIGRAGVGMDNIDVTYAQKKGLMVFNTPEASSRSVAELVFAHLFSGIRNLHDSNRNMPLEGDSNFKNLKKVYSTGTELQGKTLGIIGLGRIGKEVAKIAFGCGMHVIATPPEDKITHVSLSFPNNQNISLDIPITTFENLIETSDFITVHIPAQKSFLINHKEISKMKTGVGIINTARGGIIDESALLEGLESGKISFAGLDVFENEPTPSISILMHPGISLSPHIGGSTVEAQDRIAIELATKIIGCFKNSAKTQ